MKANVITKAKKMKSIDIEAKHSFLFYHEGAYKMDGHLIKLPFQNNKLGTEAEIYFVEGNPSPIGYVASSDTKDIKDSKLKMLDEVVLKNVLENLSEVSGEGIFSKLIALFGNPKFWVAGIFALILLGIILGFLGVKLPT